MLDESAIFDLLRDSLQIAVVISAPILVSALIAGVVIGLFQALTSIQEMTLTFVPKLFAIVTVFWTTMSMMTRNLVDFFQQSIVPNIIGV